VEAAIILLAVVFGIILCVARIAEHYPVAQAATKPQLDEPQVDFEEIS